LDQQPVLLPIGLALTVAIAHADQRPPAPELAPVQDELQGALAITGARSPHRLPPPAVPDDDLAGAVVAGGNLALEPSVLDGMILDVHREPLLARHRRRLLRHRPALQHPVQLEPEIIVEPARGVALDHEREAVRGPAGPPPGLRRVDKVSLAAVGRETHGSGGLAPPGSAPVLSGLGEAPLEELRDVDDVGALARRGFLRSL